MVLEFILTLVIAFIVVVSGSYIGAKMALNTFFGRDFEPAASTESAARDADSDE